MDTRDIFTDAFGRISEGARRVAQGLPAPALSYRPDPEANSVGWLVWHLTRVQDDHVSEIAGRTQAYIDDGWAERLGLSVDPHDTGYGHTPMQVAAVRFEGADELLDYHHAVYRRTLEYLETIGPDELERIIDRRWDPPVTVGVRLVSVIDDSLEHVGQAGYVRGLYERLG